MRTYLVRDLNFELCRGVWPLAHPFLLRMCKLFEERQLLNQRGEEDREGVCCRVNQWKRREPLGPPPAQPLGKFFGYICGATVA